MATKKRPAQPLVRECDHCGGDGEVPVFCEDCGNELDTDSVDPDSEDEICRPCAADRKAENGADTASPLPGETGKGTP